MKVKIFKPALSGCSNYGEMVEAYYARNLKIVENSDVIYAFVSSDRKGGTENTIKHARKLGVEVRLR